MSLARRNEPEYSESLDMHGYPTSVDRFCLFSLFWGAHTVIEMGKWGSMFKGPLEFSLFSIACIVCLFPRNVFLLSTLATIQLLVDYLRAPYLTNHSVMCSLASVTLLVTFAIAQGRNLRNRIDQTTEQSSGAWYELFSPLLRAQLIIVYFMAAFHKLNTGWFDPETSCAVLFWHHLIGMIPGLQRLESLGPYMPTFVIVVEFLLPVLLWVPRWRTFGVIVGLLFHLPLGVIGFFRFSCIVTALYTLFLPDRLLHVGCKEVRALMKASPRLSDCLARFNLMTLRWTFAVVIVCAMVVGWLLLPNSASNASLRILREFTGGPPPSLRFLLARAIWFGATFLVLIAILRLVCKSKTMFTAKLSGSSRVVPRWLWVLPLVALVNGLLPYVGWKTEGSFSMFSNLRTGGFPSNHLVIKNPLELLPELSQPVEIISSSDPELVRLGDRNYRLPWIELCSFVNARLERGEDFSLTIDSPKGLEEFTSVANAADRFADSTLGLRKFVWFRPVSWSEKCPCTH